MLSHNRGEGKFKKKKTRAWVERRFNGRNKREPPQQKRKNGAGGRFPQRQKRLLIRPSRATPRGIEGKKMGSRIGA